MPAAHQTPYWRLSGFYFFYFASLGAIVPFWNLYLKALSYSATQTGVFIAILMITRVVAPNVWGWIADHTGRRMAIVRTGCLLAAVIYAGILLNQSYWWMVAVMSLFSFFWNAALPQFEATTLSHLGEESHRYSAIRLWGSIGFVLAVVGLGYAFEVISILHLPLFILGLLSGIWIMSLTVPEQAASHLHIEHESISSVLRKPHVVGLLAASFCMQVSHGPYYAIYSRYMESYDYSVSAIGWLWALGVIAEIGIFMIMHHLFKRYSLRGLMLFSLAMAAVRWLLIAVFPVHLGIMLFAQLLHAVTFGVFHATAIRLVHQLFRGRHQGKGQALYSSLSFGAGGAVGSLYSGLAWDHIGRPAVFVISVLFSLLGMFLTWRYVKLDFR
ncbi:MAG: MFS transporter [Gammaproteobacteria bacterium]|nr:MFS transporter [Gammaproteobacteria bacterium]